MSSSPLDVLAFAAHPDDAEIFCGGALALFATRGYRVGVVDLTRGELASQGALETRAKETAEATKILGLAHRECLALPDGRLHELDEAQCLASVRAIRRLRPELVLLPYWEDRHPDHVQASKLLTRALFFSGLAKYDPADPGTKPHRPLQALYYSLRTTFTPSFVVDVTPVYDTKSAAIHAYKSQVERAPSGELPTLISSPLSVSSIAARDEFFGSHIGVKYGEPFIVRTALAIGDPLEFFRKYPVREPLAAPSLP